MALMAELVSGFWEQNATLGLWLGFLFLIRREELSLVVAQARAGTGSPESTRPTLSAHYMQAALQTPQK